MFELLFQKSSEMAIGLEKAKARELGIKCRFT